MPLYKEKTNPLKCTETKFTLLTAQMANILLHILFYTMHIFGGPNIKTINSGAVEWQGACILCGRMRQKRRAAT